MSHYKLLGIPIAATEEDVRNGYKQSVLKAHPDKGGTAQMFKNIQDAYNVLRDTNKKKIYDSQLAQLHKQKKFSSSSSCPTAMTNIKTPLAFPLLNGTQYVFEIAPDQLRCRFRHGDIVQCNTAKQRTGGVSVTQTGTFVGKASNGFYWRKDGDSYASLLYTEGFGGDRDVTLVYRGSSSLNSTGSFNSTTSGFNTSRRNTSTPSTPNTNPAPSPFKGTTNGRTPSTNPNDSTDSIPKQKRSSSSSTTTQGTSAHKPRYTDPNRSSSTYTTPRYGVYRATNGTTTAKPAVPRRPSPVSSRRNVYQEFTAGAAERSKSAADTSVGAAQESRRKLVREARLKQIAESVRRLFVLEGKKREEIEAAVDQYIVCFFKSIETLSKSPNTRAYHLRTMFPSNNLKPFSSVGVLLRAPPTSSGSGGSGEYLPSSAPGVTTPKRTHSASSTPRRTTTLHRSPSVSTVGSTMGSTAKVRNPPSNKSSNHHLHPLQQTLHPYNVPSKKVSLTARPTTTYTTKYSVRESVESSPGSTGTQPRDTSIGRSSTIHVPTASNKGKGPIGRHSENMSDVASVTSSRTTSRSKRSGASYLRSRSAEINSNVRTPSRGAGQTRAEQVSSNNPTCLKSFRDGHQRMTESQKQHCMSPLSSRDNRDHNQSQNTEKRSNCSTSASPLRYARNASPLRSSPNTTSNEAISASLQRGLNSSRNTLPTAILEQIRMKDPLKAMPEEEIDVSSSILHYGEGVEQVTAQSLIAASSLSDPSKSADPPVVARKHKPPGQQTPSFNGTTFHSTTSSVIWSTTPTRSDDGTPVPVTRSDDGTPIDVDSNKPSNITTPTVRLSKPISFGQSKGATPTQRSKGVSFAIDAGEGIVQQEVPIKAPQPESEKEEINADDVEESETLSPDTDARNNDDVSCNDMEDDSSDALFSPAKKPDKSDNKSAPVALFPSTVPITSESAQFLKNIYLQKNNGGGKIPKKTGALEKDDDLENRSGKVSGLQPLCRSEGSNGSLKNGGDDIALGRPIASSISSDAFTTSSNPIVCTLPPQVSRASPSLLSSYSSSGAASARYLGNMSRPFSPPVSSQTPREVPSYEMSPRRCPPSTTASTSSPSSPAAGNRDTQVTSPGNPISILKNGYTGGVPYARQTLMSRSGHQSPIAAPPPILTLRKVMAVA